MANTGKRRSSKSKLKTEPDSYGFDNIKDYWDSQAEQHGASDLATNPDQHYRALEIESILRVIGTLKDHQTILDVGCGNGHTAFQIASKFPHSNIVGVDFSAKMIEEAIQAATHNTAFVEGDVLSLSRHPDLEGKQFDVVLSSRCLINLANWQEQKVGILEMRKMLKPDGRLILVENVQDGLDNLNHLRAQFGLDPIQVRWHNKYLPNAEVQKFFTEIQGHLLTPEYVENIGNFYYMASRVMYAKMCKDQGIEPDYNNPINAIASKMPTMGEHYACSPNFMFVLKNEAGNSWDRKNLSS